MHGDTANCTIDGALVKNAASREWGHTVSRDGAVWEDWPGIDADSEWDAVGVFSGNCAIRDNGKPVCIYSNGACNVGVCAYSDDFVTWNKSGCMTQAPNPDSETNHDTSIWRDSPTGTWHILSGGCTFNGSNTPRPGVPCKGTGQMWNSTDLVTFNYVKAITPGGPGPCVRPSLPLLPLPYFPRRSALPHPANVCASVGPGPELPAGKSAWLARLRVRPGQNVNALMP